MKPILILCSLCCLMYLSLNSQKANSADAAWMKEWTNFDPNHFTYDQATETLPKYIREDTYLHNDITYLLSGPVYVVNGAILTIQEGTVIRCDPTTFTALFVTKDAKLIARGIKEQPIIFTSNQPEGYRKSGDWGGIIIAGAAPVQNSEDQIIKGNFNAKYVSYGGSNPDEVSIILTYARIEFAGKKDSSHREQAGLSLYAVGSSSLVHHIMVSHSEKDSFGFFGGNIRSKNLISYKAKDDDYYFSESITATLDSLLSVRHPYISDASGSHSITIEENNLRHTDNKKSSIAHSSNVRISNATLLTLTDHTTYQHTGAAILIHDLSKLTVQNSRISGFSNIVQLDNSFKSYMNLQKYIRFENNVFNIHDDNLVTASSLPNKSSEKLFEYNMSTKYFKEADDFFENPLKVKNPSFSLKNTEDSEIVTQ